MDKQEGRKSHMALLIPVGVPVTWVCTNDMYVESCVVSYVDSCIGTFVDSCVVVWCLG